MISEQVKIVIDGVPGVWTPDEPVVDYTTPEGYLSPHFREAEFDCNHCGEHGYFASPELLDVLEKMRAHFGGAAVTINSGVRCDQHNAAVGGANNSRHKTEYADAADVVVAGVSPDTVHAYFAGEYPNKYGLGRYSSFTHIDVRPGGPARW